MRFLFTTFVSLFILLNTAAASKIEVTSEFFTQALSFAANNDIDTLVLTSDGGVYTTTDTFYFAIKSPLVIMADPSLADPPIFTHSANDSGVLEIFRIMDDVTFDGVIFDGGHALSHGMKYALRVGDDEPDPSGNVYPAKVGLNITINNCIFRNIYRDKDLDQDGHGLYFLLGVDAGNVKITNCTFENIGYEAIRISETEKYPIDRCLDTLIVQNCTFINIDNECVRFYHDTNAETDDAYVLLENITIYNSAVRSFYVKSVAGIAEGVGGATILRNVIVANARLDGGKGRSDYVLQIQGSTAYVSNVDTFMMVYDPFTKRDETVEATKGGTVDTNTIYNFDPLFVDPENGDFTLAEGSPAYYSGYNGGHMGDLRWATNPPLTAIGDKKVSVPHLFSLKQNYPNPFNPATTIKYSLPKAGLVKLTIHDINGKQIAEVVNGHQNSGEHTAFWSSTNAMASGIYFYRLQSGANIQTRKMMLIK